MTKQRLKWLYGEVFGHSLLRDASKVIALSQTEAEQYKTFSVPAEKIAVVPNGIDLTEYSDLPPKGDFKKKFGIDKNEKIVLYLGRIHESKGLGMLAEAFSFVTKEIENVRLVLVGPDDGYALAFSRIASTLGIRRKVLLTGFINEENKLAALIDSEVFVTPRFFGFPITFLETCVAGCPIVTTSDELDWIHCNVGFVVKNSTVALAEAISTILQDKVTRERFRNNCKSMIKNFEISNVVSQLEKVYQEALLN
jgi:glycosyltransferase involved in cell wall biosynthesis